MRSLKSDDRVSFASVGDVLLVCAHDRERPESFHLAREHIRSLAASRGHPIGLLFLVDHEKGPPPGFVDHAKAVLDRCRRDVVSVSVSLGTQGFVAAVYRSVGALILTALGQRGFIGIHPDVESACEWLVGKMANAEVSESELVTHALALVAAGPRRDDRARA